MLDVLDLPKNVKADVQVFTVSDTSTLTWQTYIKPRGATMCYIYAVGGGGGGGGGRTGAAASARGGGGGGSSGTQSVAILPLNQLPDVMYVYVGYGGAGGAANTAGSVGDGSYVCVAPAFVSSHRIVAALGGNGGAAGLTTAGGAGGTSVAAATIGIMPLAGEGIFNMLASQAGSAGGAHTGAVGAALAFPTTGLNVMGGTGGGGTTSADFAGGLITAVTSSYISESRPVNTPAGSNNGSGGWQFTLNGLVYNYSGMGGGSSNTGVGGNGGDGGIGCGGGGGGGGTTGGTGGKGGNGKVIIISF